MSELWKGRSLQLDRGTKGGVGRVNGREVRGLVDEVSESGENEMNLCR